MHIGVNTRFLQSGSLEGFGIYTHELLSRMVVGHGEDDFDFYFDRSFDSQFVYGSNVRPQVLRPQARHPWLFRYWYQVPLKNALKRAKPDVFFSPDSFIPLGASLCPRVMTLHDVAYLRFPGHIGRAHLSYYQRYMPKFVSEADTVITVSQFSRNEILNHYDVSPQKVKVIYNGVSEEFEVSSDESRRSARAKYSGGRPYFLYIGSIHPRKNIARLITAFDQYRKASPSETELVVAGRMSWKYGDVKRAIERSAYKDSIRLTGYVSQDVKKDLYAGALGLVNMSLYEGFGLQVIEAQASGLPVLVSAANSTGGALAEIAGPSAFQADPLDAGSIAHGLHVLAQHESDAARAESGLANARKYSWRDASEKTYAVLKDLNSRK